MVKVQRTFHAGKMNKVVDERLLPTGEYIDGQNIRLGSTETSEIGSIELTRGNLQISEIQFNGTAPSAAAKCIGALEDTTTETIYWFIHDPSWPGQGVGSPVTTTILDLVVSYNTRTLMTEYHLVSVQEGASNRSTLNFDPQFLITGVNLVDDLLLWTDNTNPPRCINVQQGYPTPTIAAGVVTSTDNISAEEIRVIVRPPLGAPLVTNATAPEQFNFLEERFVSFAYRYRYESGEYSATSQFSHAAFIPENFKFSPQSYLNEGMMNKFNMANITVNTGSSLVREVEILWKDNDNGIIKVMERLKKAGNFADNIDVTRTFNTSKILTVLPDSEILRLYDNVPRFAKAQTLMGNRLVYGNYIENYDLKNADSESSQATNIDYTVAQVNNEIGETELSTTLTSGFYTINGVSTSVPNTLLSVDFTPIAGQMVGGSLLSIIIDFTVGYTNGTDFIDLSGNGGGSATNPIPFSPAIGTAMTDVNTFQVSFDYNFPLGFSGVDDLVVNSNFISQVGLSDTIQPFIDAGSGFTWTDLFNSSTPDAFMTGMTPAIAPYNLYGTNSGISVPDEPMSVLSNGTEMVMTFPSVTYSQNQDGDLPTSYQYFFQATTVEAMFFTGGAPRSLHSNRGYEVGMVYMDAFKRATTAFTSSQNVIHVGCQNSYTQNSIQVSIPTTQIAPWWAQTYKFVIKPSAQEYETVFSNLVFKAAGSVDAYILLEGENARKVEEGSRLLVKADMGGPVSECKYVTVLEKAAKSGDWLSVPADPDDPDVGSITPPPGIYMKIKATGVNLKSPPGSIITTGYDCDTTTYKDDYPVIKLGGTTSGFNKDDGTPWDIPSGSRIRFEFKFERSGTGSGNGPCEKRKYVFKPPDFYAGNDYANIIEWAQEEDIKSVIEANTGDQTVGGDGCDIDNFWWYEPTTNINALSPPGEVCVNGWRFYQDLAVNERIKLLVRGTRACGTGNVWTGKKAKVCGEVTMFRASNVLIFETLPTDALPDVWFEGQDNYNIVDGDHMSGTAPGDVDQNISTGTAGQLFLSNYNCYAFGNGCESYTIRDSVKGASIGLGNRVTATASQDYGRMHRYADLTYSGVYNDQSNINKLNEFNLGLLNYKPLEDSFGPVQKLVGRKSDILVLQEDKISYVLAGKNLLSDSTGGGAVTATPVVLGTQVARLEEYGISNNPESYAEYGYDKYFTDAKRGAVLQLKGGSHTNEELTVVSEYGMRSWFRDVFNEQLNTQKLGGYDPFMNEYVLSINDILLPADDPCHDCGGTFTYNLSAALFTITFCVELGLTVGEVTISTDNPAAVVMVDYDGAPFSGLGGVTFLKSAQIPSFAEVTVLAIIPTTVTLGCPIPVPLRVCKITINSPQYGSVNNILNPFQEGLTVHNQHSFVAGDYQSNMSPPNDGPALTLLNMGESLTGDCLDYVTSQCECEDGFQGEGAFPTEGNTVTIASTTVTGVDTFNFDALEPHRLLYWRTDTTTSPIDCEVYADVETVLSNATNVLPITQITNPSEVISGGTFTMPAPSGGGGTDVLYLVYDYRVSEPLNLCHIVGTPGDEDTIEELCCECQCSSGNATYSVYTNTVITAIDGSFTQVNILYTNTAGLDETIYLTPGQAVEICVLSTGTYPTPVPPLGYENLVDITIVSCGCS